MKKGEAKSRGPREKVIVPAAETEDVRFREGGAVSPYRDLLDELLDAPRGSTLKIHKAARYTATKHIRELGLKVLWGKKGEWLYIKIVGEMAEEERPLTIPRAVKQAAEGSRASAQEALVLAALVQGPMTIKEIARVVGATPTSCAGTLSRMVANRMIEAEDGVYRRMGAA